jgi:hypothetical protein
MELTPSDRTRGALRLVSDVFPRRSIGEPAVRVDFVVVGHPMSGSGYGGSGIGERIDAHVVALEGFHERLGDTVAPRAFDRVKQGSRLSASAMSMVLAAA